MAEEQHYSVFRKRWRKFKTLKRGWYSFVILTAALALTVLMKNSLMENLGQDYVRTAFAKGLSERRVILVHTLRNSLIPIATGLGHALGILMAGSYLIEFVFNIPGMGLYIFESIFARDYNAIMAVLLISAVLTLIGLLITDISYAIVDPRISFD